MIKRIELTNFMSHKHTVIEPAQGLTVLVGPNNCGKSAVVNALEVLCNNATGNYMVRHKEKETKVTVETDDGHTLTWRRRGTTVSYIIDGVDIHRLKGGVPDELHRLLRLPGVESGENGEPFDIHFGQQKSPIFLLNEPESRAALFFASSSDAAILLEMQKRHRSRVRDRRNDEKRLRSEVEGLERELTVFEPLANVSRSVNEAEERHQQLVTTCDCIETLSGDIESLATASRRNCDFHREYHSVAQLESPPVLADACMLELRIGELSKLQTRFRFARAEATSFGTMTLPPELADVDSLGNAMDALSQAKDQAEYASLQTEIGRQLRPVPEFHDLGPLETLHRRLSAELGAQRAASRKFEQLASLRKIPEIADVSTLTRTVAELRKAQFARTEQLAESCLFATLQPPIDLVDVRPLENFIELLKRAARNIAAFHADANQCATALQSAAAALIAAEDATIARSPVPEPRHPRLLLVGFSGLVAVAAVVLFILWSIWSGDRPIDRAIDPSVDKVTNLSPESRGNNRVNST